MSVQVQPVGNVQDLVVIEPQSLPAVASGANTDAIIIRRNGKLYTITPALLSGLVATLLDLDAGAYAPIDTDGALAANADDRIASQKAIRTYVAAQLAGLINSAPAALDTLNELAAALGNDANFGATVTAALAGKQAASSQLSALAAISGTTFGRALIALADASALRSAAGAGAGTYSQMQAATGMTIGARWWCTDVGISGSEWVYNGTAWTAPSSLVTHRKVGSVAAPLASITGVTSGALSLSGGNPAFPAGLLLTSSKVCVRANFGRAGSGGTWTINCKFGNGTGTDYNALGQGGIAAANGYRQDTEIYIETASAWLANAFGAPGATSVATSSYIDRTASISLANPLYISWDVGAMNAADTVSLLAYEIELRR